MIASITTATASATLAVTAGAANAQGAFVALGITAVLFGFAALRFRNAVSEMK